MATSCLGEVERRAAGAAGDLKQVMFGRKPEPGEKTVIFIHRQPAVLADIDAKSFLSNDLENVLVELAVGVVKEIDVFRQVTFAFWAQCASNEKELSDRWRERAWIKMKVFS